MKRRTTLLILTVILILGGLLRFYSLSEFPLGLYPDEAMNGNNALEALQIGEFKIFYPENNGREGLYVNMLALPLWIFGNEPFAIRMMSALFGVLTILGVYLLTRELFRPNSKLETPRLPSASPQANGGQVNSKQSQNPKTQKLFRNSILEIRDSYGDIIALLSSFFIAMSYWHINFSRIGFRGILVPFFAAFGLYFLLKGLRSGKILDLVWAGIFIGLGFHTYIAFRFMPFVIAIPLIWYLLIWWKSRKNQGRERKIFNSKSCIPCAILLFLFITFVTALPIGLYFLQNPGDFLGRAGDVSIFSAESPLTEFAKSNLLTAGMFFVRGDCNWRHNYNCQPQLNPIVAFFFIIGLLVGLRELFRNYGNDGKNLNSSFLIPNSKLITALLFTWLLIMTLPATLTREGLPHALRSIGMIPPVMIFAGFGAWWFLQTLITWFEKQKSKFPDIKNKISRIQRELGLLLIFIILLIPIMTHRTYFLKWAQNEKTFFAFSTDTFHLGQYLDGLPQDVQKYVLVNSQGVEVRGIPMPAQTIMFATNSFPSESRRGQNIVYVTDIESITPAGNKKTVITLIDGLDRDAILNLKKDFSEFREWAPGDFTVFQNF